MQYKISLTESFRSALNRLDSILQEAKPDNLGQGMLDKLFKTYQSRDINDNTLPQQFENGLQVADYIYQHVGPDFLTWAAKQYNQDQNFFLHDLHEWKNVLDQFRTVLKDKRVQIERDINRYQNIDALQQAIAQAGGAQQEMGSKFYERVIDKLDPFVQSGKAKWVYKGNDYSIFLPMSWEASQAVASACPHKTTVCVAAAKSHYDRYIRGGLLLYTIGQEDVYLDFIKNKEGNSKSEFANSTNDHKYDLNWQIQKFPLLKSVVIQVVGNALLKGNIKYYHIPPAIQTPEFYQYIVSKDGAALKFVPSEIQHQDPEICKIAVSQKGHTLEYVPPELRKPELCKIAVSDNSYSKTLKSVPPEILQQHPELCEIAVSNNGYALDVVPEELRTPRLCKIAVSKSGGALRYVPEKLRKPQLCKIAVSQEGNALDYVPEKLRNYELCKIAISHFTERMGDPFHDVPYKLWFKYPELCEFAVSKYGEALWHIPEEMITPELCKLAVSNNGLALRNVPEEIMYQHPALCKIAVSQEGTALRYVPEDLRKPQLCKLAVSKDGRALEDVPEKILQKYPELKEIAKQNIPQS